VEVNTTEDRGGRLNQISPKGSLMKTLRFTPRTLLAAMLIPVLASCSDKAEQMVSPDLRTQMTGEEGPPNWQIYVCKIGPEGTTANFEANATAGTLMQSNPFQVTSGLLGAPPSCKLAWQAPAGTAVTYNVTELPSAGLVLDTIRFNRNVPGASYTGTTATITDEYLAHADVKGFAVITYKNDEAPDGPLQVSKTAAGTYEIPVRWELQKTVNPTSHTGTIGTTAGSSTWTVTATRIEGAATNHMVTGTVTVTNPIGNAPKTFTVADNMNGNAVTVTCPQYTLAGGETTTCTYSAAQAGATLNTATVSTEGMPDVVATAAVAYTSSFTGDETVTLADPRFSYSTVISSSKTVTFPETFPCPSDAALYVNGTYTYTVKNTATLKGNTTDLSRDATVTVTCTKPQNAETATGAGFPWAATQGAPNNWFMYTPWVTTGAYRGISAAATSTQPAGTNLIAGQHYIAGRITGTRGTTTSITVTLNSAWGWVNASEIMINPMSCTTAQPYVPPGQFTYKKTITANSVTVSGLPNTACYGIHGGVYEK
jgi:hypothetical protein